MNIKFIAPYEQSKNCIATAMPFKIQKLSLSLLAALTPHEHPVTIVDEAFAPDDTSDSMDSVGITVMTDVALKACRIADTCRQRGTKVLSRHCLHLW